MANIADKVFELIKDTVEKQNVILWNVCFVKEGATYYLRVFIDSENGITLDDCTNVSHAIDPVIDEADPIDESYFLEVCSPGLERELVRPEHFSRFIGKSVKIKLYKPYEGKKEIIADLLDYDGGIRLKTEKEEMYLQKGEFAKIKVNDSMEV